MEVSGGAEALRAVHLGAGQRYDVVITNLEGRVVSYRVATRMSREKATAIAVSVFIRHYPDPDQRLFGVTVREVGPVPAVVDEHGHILSFKLDEQDMVDPYEWS